MFINKQKKNRTQSFIGPDTANTFTYLWFALNISESYEMNAWKAKNNKFSDGHIATHSKSMTIINQQTLFFWSNFTKNVFNWHFSSSKYE